ncbi:40S small subunit processome assembly factor 1 [Anableps anableps]
MSSELDGGNDEDCLFLERVLDSLYDFGSETKKNLKTQKKKKRKRCEEEEETEEELHTVKETCSDNEDSGDAEVQQPNTELKGPSIQLQNKVEVVTFQDPKKKTKTKQSPVSSRIPAKSLQDPRKAEQKQINQQEQLSLEKARLEVHRFGITGYKKEQQRVFEQDRAIMLGARPPKKEYVNYKVLQEQIKEKKQKQKEELQPDKKKKKKSNQRDKKKQPASGSGVAPSGQVGRFKNGMLVLSSKEIQKIKGKK